MKTGRNEPCSCGSGKKYKNCCLDKEKSFAVSPTIKPDVINTHLVSTDGKTWQEKPGLLYARITVTPTEHNDDAINELFKSVMEDGANKRMSGKLIDCRHKLYAVKYHLDTLINEIDKQVDNFQTNYRAGAGVITEVTNPVLVYETEAFLFQIKSSLDLLVQALGCVVPCLKSLRSFAHKGAQGGSDYIAGGKVLALLKKSNEDELADCLDQHRVAWIQEMVVMRDTITHHSSLKGFNNFLEDPYMGCDRVSIHFPTMPSGERLDYYCNRVFDGLCSTYDQILNIVVSRSIE